MNHVVANRLLMAELSAYRSLPFEELCQVVGERSTRLVRRTDGVDYDLTTIVQWRLDPGGEIRVNVFVGEANWGGPHDATDESIVISRAS